MYIYSLLLILIPSCVFIIYIVVCYLYKQHLHHQWQYHCVLLCWQYQEELLFNSLHAGKFFMIICRLLNFFKISFFEKFLQDYHQSSKQFVSRSGPTFCRARSGSKMFAKVISSQHWKVNNLVMLRCHFSDLDPNCLQR